MTKQNGNVKEISSKLTIEKDEFETLISERIIIGNELFIYPVKMLHETRDSFGGTRGIYDEAEEKKFIAQYNKWKQFNTELLKRSFDTPDNEYVQEYEKAERSSIWSDWVKERKEDIQNQVTVLESLIERLALIPMTKDAVAKDAIISKDVTNKIFIVHGHNNEIKQTLARTLSQLKLEPIILHEQAEQGRTIIEKFEKNSSDVNFAIILLTSDDVGKSNKETAYKARARQNVVFEMGYFIGKLGRNKVFLLIEHGVDKPGDLDGIVYVPIDDADGWKLKLVRELRIAGYSVTADDL
ncbi:nucleotide-binding protein [Marivirga sp.]|uniref:nucleotide-binding protein n=1 Tax=Marivirga sp. TaxID=2018662 RepID=UPI002D7F4565|nr:nucleotide-binding protein [Marivirga sp.]HET8860031.1 nucleotide-binding protein [Marivirga sp.]